MVVENTSYDWVSRHRTGKHHKRSQRSSRKRSSLRMSEVRGSCAIFHSTACNVSSRLDSSSELPDFFPAVYR